MKELWNILCEMKLRGSLSKAQFENSVKYVLLEGSGKDDRMVDYESLCRYTVRMGRAFNSLVQETRIIDDKKYSILKENLRKELLAMMNALRYFILIFCYCEYSFYPIGFLIAYS